jgi:galactose-1-phosphate uridylyltransferase
MNIFEKQAISNVINMLNEIEVTGEMMESIIREVGMEDQMLRQLVMKASEEELINFLDEKRELKGGTIMKKTIDYKEKYEELLKEFEQYKKESIKWSVEDFTEYEHPEFTINDQQAQDALERMIRKHDASLGISWNTIEYYIEEYGELKEATNAKN